jgi:GTP-binding protein
MSELPTVAVVGRPNVGKSTLFNRIIKSRKAIVHYRPGVTRDVQRQAAEWNGIHFEIVDTGGLFSGVDDSLIREVEEKALAEALNSDALLFLTDAETGLTPADMEIANHLRGFDAPVFIGVNKTEKSSRRFSGSEFFKLGFANIYEISALHGQGIGDLLDGLVAVLPKRKAKDTHDSLKIAFVGCPNVGKSSLVNALLGKEIHLVDERPGTTRDSIDLRVQWHGQSITLVDTAGIKRKSKSKDGITKLSALKSIETIDRADIAVLMLDAAREIANQDIKVGSYAHKAGKGVLICVNKWDLVDKSDKTYRIHEDKIRRAMAYLSYAPILFISALTGQRIHRVLSEANKIAENRNKRISTSVLNQFLEVVSAKTPPPFHAGGTGRIYYATQVETAPPRFMLFVNKRAFFGRAYLRFLNNQIRQKFPFNGTVIRINLTEKQRRGAQS